MSDRRPEGMPGRMPEDLPDRTPEDLPDRTPDWMPEDMPEDMPDRMPDRMPEDMPEHMPEDMTGRMPEDMPHRMPDRMPEDLSDIMPENLPVTTRINVMVSMTRSKVICLSMHVLFLQRNGKFTQDWVAAYRSRKLDNATREKIQKNAVARKPLPAYKTDARTAKKHLAKSVPKNKFKDWLSSKEGQDWATERARIWSVIDQNGASASTAENMTAGKTKRNNDDSGSTFSSNTEESSGGEQGVFNNTPWWAVKSLCNNSLHIGIVFSCFDLPNGGWSGAVCADLLHVNI